MTLELEVSVGLHLNEAIYCLDSYWVSYMYKLQTPWILQFIQYLYKRIIQQSRYIQC